MQTIKKQITFAWAVWMVSTQCQQDTSNMTITGEMARSKARCSLRKRNSWSSLWSVSVQSSVYAIHKLWGCVQCVYIKFAYGNVSDPLKMYYGKDCVENFKRVYRRWGKEYNISAAYNISTATHDRAYWYI